MFITQKILEERGACEAGRVWFAKRFPDGAELVDVIESARVTKYFLDWGMKALDPSPEEWAVFYKRFEIDCGEYNNTIYKSEKIGNSQQVFSSKRVYDSINIYNSKKIKNSNNVFKSEIVENSFAVFDSFYIYDSEKINHSENINSSNNILFSNYVINSNSIINSQQVTDSGYVVSSVNNRTENIRDSFFIRDGKNLTNCLFCKKLEDSNFYMFNQPVSEANYNIVKRQLLSILEDYNASFVNKWPVDEIPLNNINFIQEEKDYFKHLPDEFYKWVKTLPNYCPLTMFTITLNPRFLK